MRKLDPEDMTDEQLDEEIEDLKSVAEIMSDREVRRWELSRERMRRTKENLTNRPS